MIIDEISFFARWSLRKLDNYLRKFTGQNKPSGGILIVLSRNFHQLKPITSKELDRLYLSTKNGLWEGSLNVSLFLEKSHRFDDDPKYGDILAMIWYNQMTQEGVIGDENNLQLPGKFEGDISYA